MEKSSNRRCGTNRNKPNDSPFEIPQNTTREDLYQMHFLPLPTTRNNTPPKSVWKMPQVHCHIIQSQFFFCMLLPIVKIRAIV